MAEPHLLQQGPGHGAVARPQSHFLALVQCQPATLQILQWTAWKLSSGPQSSSVPKSSKTAALCLLMELAMHQVRLDPRRFRSTSGKVLGQLPVALGPLHLFATAELWQLEHKGSGPGLGA